MALVILITAILISALVVKVGTVALTMTGMDRRKATFQAKSAFTNTGWTTREAELIMAHDQRRRIVGAMMALGYAGFASVIATLIASLGQRGVIGLLGALPSWPSPSYSFTCWLGGAASTVGSRPRLKSD
jgi:hypothetical protein